MEDIMKENLKMFFSMGKVKKYGFVVKKEKRKIQILYKYIYIKKKYYIININSRIKEKIQKKEKLIYILPRITIIKPFIILK